MTIAPRLLILTIFFGSCRGVPVAITVMIFGLVYLITFLPLVIPKYKNLKTENNSESYPQGLILSFFSAILSPCIVVNPKTKTLLFSSLASCCAHLVLLIYLIVFSNSKLSRDNPEKFLQNEFLRIPSLIEEETFKMICYSLLGLLVISYFFSGILHQYSKPEFECCVCPISVCQSQSSTDEITLEIIPRLLASNDISQEENIDQEANEKIKDESAKNSTEGIVRANSKDSALNEPLLSSEN